MKARNKRPSVRKKVNLAQSICVCAERQVVTARTGPSGSPVPANRLPSWCLCLVYDILSAQARRPNCTL